MVRDCALMLEVMFARNGMPVPWKSAEGAVHAAAGAANQSSKGRPVDKGLLPPPKPGQDGGPSASKALSPATAASTLAVLHTPGVTKPGCSAASMHALTGSHPIGLTKLSRSCPSGCLRTARAVAWADS